MSETLATHAPTGSAWDVYGSRISYYTGKLEACLRLYGIEYRILPVGGNGAMLKRKAGASQMPVVRIADGRWMSDTTPILAWIDSQRSTSRSGGRGSPSIYPDDPALRLVGLLIEDYADEWLWRSAMHYRWSYRLDREYASEILYEEQLRHTLKVPRCLGKRILKKRQMGGFVKNDGVDDVSRPHADATYLNALRLMQGIVLQRRFVLGNRPSIADFGMMGPMFRHFGQDPTPSQIMRERAPDVFAWVARMWNLKARDMQGDLIFAIDAPLSGLLREISETHLEQLRQNAHAFSQGQTHYALRVQGALYASVPVSRYRVWCLETLRREWSQLRSCAQSELAGHLTNAGAELLHAGPAFAPSGYDAQGAAPFNRAINVFDGGVPRRA